MPDDIDVPDLDPMFGQFTQRVAEHSRPPGAQLAIRTARRRRAAATGFATAMVLVVGGLVAALLPNPESGPQPAEPSIDDRRFDVDSLGMATAGWIADWETGTGRIEADVPATTDRYFQELRPVSEDGARFHRGSSLAAEFERGSTGTTTSLKTPSPISSNDSRTGNDFRPPTSIPNRFASRCSPNRRVG